jgi:multidrug efflux pump subunit AcrB
MGGGWVRFQFFPPVEGDNLAAILNMPEGTSVDETRRAVKALESSAMRLGEKIDQSLAITDARGVFHHALASVGQQPFLKTQQEGAGKFVPNVSNAHLGEVHIELAASESRPGISSYELANAWREETGVIAGAESLKFTASIFSAGEPINLQIMGKDFDTLQAAGNDLKAILN